MKISLRSWLLSTILHTCLIVFLWYEPIIFHAAPNKSEIKCANSNTTIYVVSIIQSTKVNIVDENIAIIDSNTLKIELPYWKKVRSLISSKIYYPNQLLPENGIVSILVEITITKTGHIVKVENLSEQVDYRLVNFIINQIQRCSPFPPPPDNITNYTILLPIKFVDA